MAQAAHDATQALGGDEQTDRAARNGLPFAQNFLPKFAHTLHAAVTLPHALDLLAQDDDALNPNRTLRQIGLACTRQELPDGAIAKTRQIGSPPYRTCPRR